MTHTIEDYKITFTYEGVPLSEKLFSFIDEHTEPNENDEFLLMNDYPIRFERLNDKGTQSREQRYADKFDCEIPSKDADWEGDDPDESEGFYIKHVAFKPSTMIKVSGGTNPTTAYYLVLEYDEYHIKLARFNRFKEMKRFKMIYFIDKEIEEYEYTVHEYYDDYYDEERQDTVTLYKVKRKKNNI